MDINELLKHKGMVAIGVLVAAILLYALLRKSPQSGGTADNAGGQLYYGSGLNPQQALELAGMEVQAESANLATITSGKVNLANIAALENVSLAQNTTYGAVEQSGIAANQAVALNTNQTNAAIAAGNNAAAVSINANNNQTAEQIVANEGSTAIGLQPSWLDRLLNGPGAINLQNQTGALAQKSSGDFASMVTGLFGGQGGSLLGGLGGGGGMGAFAL